MHIERLLQSVECISYLNVVKQAASYTWGDKSSRDTRQNYVPTLPYLNNMSQLIMNCKAATSQPRHWFRPAHMVRRLYSTNVPIMKTRC